MTAAFEIPLTPQAQSLTVALAGRTYQMLVVWNHIAQHWFLDLLGADGTPVVTGIPLITGVDLLQQFRHVGFPGRLICQSDFDLNVPPRFDNLGETGHLYFIVD